MLGIQSELTELSVCLNEFAWENEVRWDPSSAHYINLVEEIGDLWWYVALLLRVLGRGEHTAISTHRPTPIAHVHVQTMLHSIKSMNTIMGSFSDTLKRCIYYGNHFNEGAIPIDSIVSTLVHISYATGIDFHVFWESNIAKLLARYPQHFASELCLSRDTDTEIRVMAAAIAAAREDKNMPPAAQAMYKMLASVDLSKQDPAAQAQAQAMLDSAIAANVGGAAVVAKTMKEILAAAVAEGEELANAPHEDDVPPVSHHRRDVEDTD
jgi:hypothetical protein